MACGSRGGGGGGCALRSLCYQYQTSLGRLDDEARAPVDCRANMAIASLAKDAFPCLFPTTPPGKHSTTISTRPGEPVIVSDRCRRPGYLVLRAALVLRTRKHQGGDAVHETTPAGPIHCTRREHATQHICSKRSTQRDCENPSWVLIAVQSNLRE